MNCMDCGNDIDYCTCAGAPFLSRRRDGPMSELDRVRYSDPAAVPETTDVRALLRECFEFTKYAACIKWSSRDTNTQEWLNGLEQQIQALQPRLQAALNATEKVQVHPASDSDRGDTDFLTQLRRVNVDRCVNGFKHELDDWSVMEWGCAIGGEAGELLNVLKKIRREEQNIGGSRIEGDRIKTVADEIADIIIYCDLLAAKMGIDLQHAITSKFNETSIKVSYTQVLMAESHEHAGEQEAPQVAPCKGPSVSPAPDIYMKTGHHPRCHLIQYGSHCDCAYCAPDALPEPPFHMGDITPEGAAYVLALRQRLETLEDQCGELQKFHAEIEAGCDIQKAHGLYRQCRVVVGPGKTEDKLRAELAESALTALRQQAEEFQRQVAFWKKSSEEWKESRDRNIQRAEQAESALTAERQKNEKCICHGNWRAIVKECEPLFGKRYRDNKGNEYTFFGIVHSDDDYYYGMNGNAGMRLLSCVGAIEGFGFELIDAARSRQGAGE